MSIGVLILVSFLGLCPVSAESSSSLLRRRPPEITPPTRYSTDKNLLEPPPIDEIERNMTLYLHTLHTELSKLQGPKAIPIDIWEKYFEVTKNLMIKWDDQNRNRFPNPRKDKSIFVSLGTYRGKSQCRPFIRI